MSSTVPMPDIASKGNDATKTGEDPDRHFEDIVSKELLQLSAKDRNNLQEELHGVNCIAPEETPQLVEDSLRNLTTELDEKIPDSQKRAYILSQQRPASKAFVNSQEFRMRFLRCELFDYKLAAERITRVCDALLRLFGWYALERPVKLSDFSNTELKIIRKGRIQTLPFRDRSGRRIVIVFPGGNSVKGRVNNVETRNLQLKIFMYMSWVLGSEVDTQRKGIVWMVWFDPNLELSTFSDVNGIKLGTKSHSVAMLRPSAIHICSPNTPFFRTQRAILSLGSGPWRKCLKSHLGETVELRYILNGYGIDADMLPISWTGNVKVAYLRQWMRIRQYLDDPFLHTHSPCDCSNVTKGNHTSKDHTCTKFSRPIECPLLTDILFKKGKSAKNHPGNIHFRSRIQMKYELERSAFAFSVAPEHPCGMEVFGKDTKPAIIKSLVDFYLEEVRKGNLRVLLWNEKQSWWSILTHERTIRKKIEKTVMSCIESTSSPHIEVTLHQHQDFLEPSNWFGECVGRYNPQYLQDFAQILTSQEEENRRKRRKPIYDGIAGVNAKRSVNIRDAEKISSQNSALGEKPMC